MSGSENPLRDLDNPGWGFEKCLVNKAKPQTKTLTLPETNIAHENPIFPGKYDQNGGFSMAMLVYRSVHSLKLTVRT